MANTKNDKDFEAELLKQSQIADNPEGVGGRRSMIDLLHEKFNADDLVRIKNFTKETTGWVYSDRKLLKIEQPDQYTRRVYQGAQKTRILKAGQTVVVPGWEAYVGLVRFFKQWIQSTSGGNVAVNMNSPRKQEEFIDQAFAGVYDPNDEPEVEVDAKKEVEEDLGLTDAKQPKAK